MIFQETALLFTVVMLMHKDKVANPAFANSAEWKGEEEERISSDPKKEIK